MKKRFWLLLLLLLLSLAAFSACRKVDAPPAGDGAVENNGGTPGTADLPETPACTHVSVTDAAVEPTCTGEGKTAGEHCALCGEVLSAQTTVAPLGHKTEPAEVLVPVSCTKWGANAAVFCTRCGELRQEEAFFPPAGHHYEDGKCTACGNEKIDYTNPKLYTSGEGYLFFATAENGDAMKKLYDEMEEDLMDFHTSSTRSAPLYGNNAELGSVYKVASFQYTQYGLTLSEAQTVYTVFRKDHPLYYWMAYYLYWNNTSIVITTTSAYAKGRDRNRTNQRVYEGIEKYASLADGESSAYNIAMIYYDAILKNNSYAYDANGGPEPAQWAHGIVGAFLYKRFVCEGYAKLFQLLLNARGIENVYVSGDAGGSHFWNLVRMDDGNWYWFDPTWGDSSDVPSRYFCVLDDAMQTHTPTPPGQYGMYFNYMLPERSDHPFESEDTLEIGDMITVDGHGYIFYAWNTLKSTEEDVQPPERLIYEGVVYQVISQQAG